MFRKVLSTIICLTMMILTVTGCASLNQKSLLLQANKIVKTESLVKEVKTEGKSPKYIFMFIGDGMSAVQVNSAQIYRGTNKHNNITLGTLNFQNFEAVGYQTTHDATSFAPDSASTATSLSSGFKTWSGTIGLRPVGNVSANKAENVNTYNIPKTIAERLKEEKGMKIGVVSTVTINHATPAAYYAHVPSRNNYYDIALQMADSGFDYFGGEQ